MTWFDATLEVLPWLGSELQICPTRSGCKKQNWTLSYTGDEVGGDEGGESLGTTRQVA